MKVEGLGEEHEVECIVRKREELARDHILLAEAVIDVQTQIAHVRREQLAVGLRAAPDVQHVVDGWRISPSAHSMWLTRKRRIR
jgi:hypothetical protein